MISIRRYLYSRTSEADEAGEGPLREIEDRAAAGEDGDAGWPLALALLEGIESHAVACGDIDSTRFQQDIRNLRAALGGGATSAEARRAGSEACAVMEEYSRSIREWNRRQAAEVQKMVAMLNETVVVLSSGSQRSIARLRTVEKELERASHIEDLVAIKAHMAECLAWVREESAREREDVARTVLLMEQRVREARDQMALERSGLPGRGEAGEAIAAAAAQAAERTFAVVLALDRYPAVHARFGAAAAEHLFSQFSAEAARRLPSPKKLFRWNRSSILALVESGKRSPELAEQVGDTLRGMPLETNLEVGGRVAVLAQSHQWHVLALAGRYGEEIAAEIEKFAAAERRGDA